MLRITTIHMGTTGQCDGFTQSSPFVYSFRLPIGIPFKSIHSSFIVVRTWDRRQCDGRGRIALVPRHAPAVPTVEHSLAFLQAPRTRIAHHAAQRGVAVDELVLAFAIRELAGVLAAKVVVIAFARVAHRQEHLCAGAGANSKPRVSEKWRYMQAGDTERKGLPTSTCMSNETVLEYTRVY